MSRLLFIPLVAVGLAQAQGLEAFVTAGADGWIDGLELDCLPPDPLRTPGGWACPEGSTPMTTEGEVSCTRNGPVEVGIALGTLVYTCAGMEAKGSWKIQNDRGVTIADGPVVDGFDANVGTVRFPNGAKVEQAQGGATGRARGVGTPRPLSATLRRAMLQGLCLEQPESVPVQDLLVAALNAADEAGVSNPGSSADAGSGDQSPWLGEPVDWFSRQFQGPAWWTLSRISGVPVTRPVIGGHADLTYFNPTFIRWMADALLAASNDQICEKPGSAVLSTWVNPQGIAYGEAYLAMTQTGVFDKLAGLDLEAVDEVCPTQGKAWLDTVQSMVDTDGEDPARPPEPFDVYLEFDCEDTDPQDTEAGWRCPEGTTPTGWSGTSAADVEPPPAAACVRPAKTTQALAEGTAQYSCAEGQVVGTWTVLHPNGRKGLQGTVVDEALMLAHAWYPDGARFDLHQPSKVRAGLGLTTWTSDDCGFWIRRSIDGTRTDVAAAIRRLLAAYGSADGRKVASKMR